MGKATLRLGLGAGFAGLALSSILVISGRAVPSGEPGPADVGSSNEGASIKVARAPIMGVDPSLLEIGADDALTTSDVLHRMKLFGADAELVRHRRNSQQPVRAALLSIVLDYQRMREVTGGDALRRSPYGLRYYPTSDAPGGAGASGESHRDHVLATLADLSIPLSQPVRYAGGEVTVGALLSDSVMTFSLQQDELAWSALAYCRYLGAAGHWTNKFNETFTFDDLADEMINRPLSRESCGGLHIIQALTKLRFREVQGRRLLDRKHMAKIDALLGRLIKSANDLLVEERPWDWKRWYESPGEHRPAESRLSPADEILLAGHILEWLLMLPPELKPAPSSLKPAVVRLRGRLESVESTAEGLAVCPYTHATLAIAGWSSP